MAQVKLANLTDTELMAHIVSTLTPAIADEGERKGLKAYLGVEMVRRIESAGFTDNALNRDTLFFSAGMSLSDVAHWITNVFEIYYESLLTLIDYKEFMSADLLGQDMPRLNLKKSLVIKYDFEDELMTGIDSGHLPLDPFYQDGEIPYRHGILAVNGLGDVFEITGSMAIDDVDVELGSA